VFVAISPGARMVPASWPTMATSRAPATRSWRRPPSCASWHPDSARAEELLQHAEETEASVAMMSDAAYDADARKTIT
jgi:hypothetical protein